MKTLTLLTAILFLGQSLIAQTEGCDRIALFGEAKICLSSIEGMQECYQEPAAKILADATEVPSNEVLGFYLDDETYASVDRLDEIEFDNYFKIYGVTEMRNLPMQKAYMKEIYKMLGTNFVSKNWDEIKNEVGEIEDNLDIEIGKPTIIKDYQINDESFTYIMLTKYQIDEENSYTMVMALNGMLLQERFICMAYYLDYDGEDSIEEVQKRSDAVLGRLLATND